MDYHVRECAGNVTFADFASHTCLWHEITEALDVVHQDYACDLVEDFHAVCEAQLHGLEVREVDHHEDGDEVLDGYLSPEELGHHNYTEAEESPSDQEDSWIDYWQPFTTLFLCILGSS